MDEAKRLRKFKSPVDEKTYFYSEAVSILIWLGVKRVWLP